MAEAEGFICALCKQDLQSFQHLEAHFREEHSESAGSKLKTNFKSFLDKAKASLQKKPQFQFTHKSQLSVDEGASAAPGLGESFGREQGPSLVEANVTNVSGFDTEAWPSQEFGSSRDHMRELKRHRDAYLGGTIVETNRLVVRLEKLFRKLKEDTPKTSKQMKSLEQKVVPWTKDDDEKTCRECHRKFGVQRRKHHCRLCGYIICKQCSHFMTLGQTYPLLLDCPDYHKLAPSPSLKKRTLKIDKPLGKKSSKKEKEEAGAHGGDDAATDELRMCSSCERLVQRRLLQIAGQEKTILEALYNKMQLVMEEADRLQPVYQEMVESLMEGEHRFTLFDVQKKRHDLIRLYETVDGISKDILGLGELETSVRDQKLGQNIRRFTSIYLQDNMLALPTLPTYIQLRELRERKEKEAQERVKELERQRAVQRQKEALSAAGVAAGGLGQDDRSGFDKFLDYSRSKMEMAGTKLTVGFKKDMSSVDMGDRGVQQSGWIATREEEIVDSAEADPFQLQKQQLLAYIKQARASNRLDEVAALEQSLRDIESLIHQQDPMPHGYHGYQQMT